MSEIENIRGLPSEASVDKASIQAAVHQVLEAIGEDPERDGLKGTPLRVARMYEELFSGLHQDPEDVMDVIFESNYDEMIMVRDIPLYSVCEHHLLPFIGQAHVAYIPNEQGCITGLSKLARVVDLLAHRPQVQERLTTQIADCIEKVLRPRGVLIVIEAEHLCMTMRGISKPGSRTITSAIRGIFRDNEPTRAEAMGLIHS
jgi:GTP cyclohydrolase IA